jgi:hypothetical protein
MLSVNWDTIRLFLHVADGRAGQASRPDQVPAGRETGVRDGGG